MQNFLGDKAKMPDEQAEKLYSLCVEKTRSFLKKLGASDVVLGLSGGIDSALVAAIAVDALGASHVHGVLMPGPYSTTHSVEDAKACAEALDIDYQVISIDEPYGAFKKTLSAACGEGGFTGLTEQNVQCRCRMVTLMALANARGWLLLNTSNKTEFYMGYSTLYGDLTGVFGPIGGLLKTQVFGLAIWRNKTSQTSRKFDSFPIPENTLKKAPSAELASGQTDQDSLGLDYVTLDEMLQVYEAQHDAGATDAKIEKLLQEKGFCAEDVQNMLARINANKFKQALAPPHP